MSELSALSERGVAVIGAGTMGAGIAQRIAQEGIPVSLIDREMHLAETGKNKIASLLEEAVQRRIFKPERVERILACVTPSDNIASARDSVLVIEAVFEDEDVKRELFQKLNLTCSPETIFASNTSSLSISRMAETSGRSDRFGGLHFFFHPAKNRLLEVISGDGTSEGTAQFLRIFGEIIGKTCIDVADRPGFAVNRFFVPWLNEAVRLLDEGVASIPTIETSARRAFEIGMGPFELMNVTGVPIAYHAARSLEKALGSFYAPAGSLKRHVEEHRNWDLEGDSSANGSEEVRDRLLGCVFAVSCALTDEGAAGREDTDRGAVVGLRWREGPFAMMNRLGTPVALDLVEKFASRYDSIAVPESLESLASKSEPWPLTFVEQHVSDGIARIVINRPESMNALNPDVVAQLADAFEAVTAMNDVDTVIFEGVGKAFVAGADIRFFVDALKDNDFDRVYSFTQQGQRLLSAISASEKQTIAFVDGMALGGGAELALACDKTVVTKKAAFAFPETGIGIYPGLGGTQRLPRKIGRPLARYLILCGVTLSADKALSAGLADVLYEDGARSEAVKRGKSIAALTRHDAHEQMDPSLTAAETLFADSRADDLLAGVLPEEAGDTEFAGKMLKLLSRKAPVALRTAAGLIDVSGKMSLEEGLQRELSYLESIFSTEDAFEGLSSVGKKFPEFKGR